MLSLDGGPGWEPKWVVVSDDMEANTPILIADPGQGLRIYITDVVISSQAEGRFDLLETSESNDEIFSVRLLAGQPFGMSFRSPIKVPAGANVLGYFNEVGTTELVSIGYYITPG